MFAKASSPERFDLGQFHTCLVVIAASTRVSSRPFSSPAADARFDFDSQRRPIAASVLCYSNVVEFAQAILKAHEDGTELLGPFFAARLLAKTLNGPASAFLLFDELKDF